MLVLVAFLLLGVLIRLSDAVNALLRIEALLRLEGERRDRIEMLEREGVE